MAAFALLFLGWLGPSGSSPSSVDVDVIELNHVYSLTESRDDFGRVNYSVNFVASYWVFWSWYDLPTNGMHVRDWVKFDPRHPISWREDGVELVVPRRHATIFVRGKVFRETWTFYDKEREDQMSLPVGKRRNIEGLRK